MYHLPNEILKKYLDPFELGTSTRPSPNDPAVSMRNLACMFKNAALVGVIWLTVKKWTFYFKVYFKLPIEPLLEVVQDILHNDESAPKDKEAMLSQFMKNLVKDIKLLEFQSKQYKKQFEALLV